MGDLKHAIRPHGTVAASATRDPRLLMLTHVRPREGSAPQVATLFRLAGEDAFQELKRVPHPEIHLHEIVPRLVDDTVIGFAKYADVRCEPVF